MVCQQNFKKKYLSTFQYIENSNIASTNSINADETTCNAPFHPDQLLPIQLFSFLAIKALSALNYA